MPGRMPTGTAIFDLQVTVTNRHNKTTGKRQSAVAGAAYRSGTSLQDALTGEIHNYVNKCDVYPDEIIAPEGAEAWVYDRGELWNQHEAKERRKDAQIYREVRVALPKAFKPDQNRSMTCEWVKDIFVSKGMVAHIGFHDLEGVNPHAHIALTMRDLLPDGFGNKNRMWNKFMPVLRVPKQNRHMDFKSLVDIWREKWSNHVNKHLDASGFEERISHLSNSEREGVSGLENMNLSKSAYYLSLIHI